MAGCNQSVIITQSSITLRHETWRAGRGRGRGPARGGAAPSAATLQRAGARPGPRSQGRVSTATTPTSTGDRSYKLLQVTSDKLIGSVPCVAAGETCPSPVVATVHSARPTATTTWVCTTGGPSSCTMCPLVYSWCPPAARCTPPTELRGTWRRGGCSSCPDPPPSPSHTPPPSRATP